MQPSPTHVRKRVVLVPTVARHPFFFSFLKTQFLTGTVLKSVNFRSFYFAIGRFRSLLLDRRSCHLFCATPHNADN
jgi:hypothetical protein